MNASTDPPDLEAVIFDFDGLIIDSERVEADCIIEIVRDWGHALSYADIGHLFGSVDADEQWDELLGAACGRTSAELEERLRTMVAPLKDGLPLLPGMNSAETSMRSGPMPTSFPGRLVTTPPPPLLRRGPLKAGLAWFFAISFSAALTCAA